MVERRSAVGLVLKRLLLVLITAFALFPFLWMVSTSIKPSSEIFSYPPVWIPQSPTFEGYTSIWSESAIYNVPFSRWIQNSLVVSVATTLFAMLIAAMGGYAMSRFYFPGRTLLGYTLLLTQMLPDALLVIPLYAVFRDLGLLNSLWGLTLAYTTFDVPFSAWMLRGYFNTISLELDEAAMVDGCTRFGAFFRVILPLTWPGFAATAVFAFILAWNEYLFASVFLNSFENWTLTIGLASFSGQYMIRWNHIMAGSVVVTMPVLLFFWFFQKHIVSGSTAGAIKG